ncbi:ABC transporter ATP-binding protein [Martelella mediterranea]|uniref:Putative siderophore transport system ATP-binding protein YusV n=1 Tax=Martelella mediterranea DSM 17316 TaxID=1122214 RepID=A0A1U9Z0K1_9HYPH|nr:ABC transporter ATP-binding protein [Martelella mediterranea]AQZ51223.1 putative siderophore transport system ATP-binding protein YusV [Martelella mediterranea DSM 17316]
MSVVADQLSWGVRRKVIVKNVSLDVREGETLGLIGPNGSGKSSLLRLLAGLKRPDRGHVEIHGRNIAHVPRRLLAREVAFVQQNAATDTNVTVRDVVRLGRTPHRSALSGWSSADQEAVSDALRRVGMEPLQNQSWQTLSGGERQRVHIARALAQSPRVLFLDEPTNHLDIHHQIEILHTVRQLDLTSIVALHDLNLAAMFCDRIIVLKDGAIVASGAPETVLTEEMIGSVFRVSAAVSASPYHGRPQIHFRSC